MYSLLYRINWSVWVRSISFHLLIALIKKSVLYLVKSRYSTLPFYSVLFHFILSYVGRIIKFRLWIGIRRKMTMILDRAYSAHYINFEHVLMVQYTQFSSIYSLIVSNQLVCIREIIFIPFIDCSNYTSVKYRTCNDDVIYITNRSQIKIKIKFNQFDIITRYTIDYFELVGLYETYRFHFFFIDFILHIDWIW